MRIDRSSLVMIGAGYAAGLLAWPSLGALNSRLLQAGISFLFPTAALAACWTIAALTRGSGPDLPSLVESTNAMRAIGTFTARLLIALHGLVLASVASVLNPQWPVHRLAVVLFGLWLMAVGNVLPRVRPNILLGIRSRRLLDNPLAWAQMHRGTGYLLVALGAIAVAAGAALSKNQIPIVFSLALLIGATLNLAAFRRWTRG